MAHSSIVFVSTISESMYKSVSSEKARVHSEDLCDGEVDGEFVVSEFVEYEDRGRLRLRLRLLVRFLVGTN